MSETKLAEKLNKFYPRFDAHDFNHEFSEFHDKLEGLLDID